MIKSVKMPKLGTTVEEVKILRWLKKEGDYVKRGDPLLEVETDKALMEVESYLTGYLKKIIMQEDEIVDAGKEIAYIGDEEDEFSAIETTDPEMDLTHTNGKEGRSVMKEKTIKASPMIKKLAQKHGVDISKINGSGTNGLIIKDDIMKAALKKESAASDNNNAETENTIAEFSRIGRAIAKIMAQSKTTIPHVYFSIDIDATVMKQTRSSSGKKISYNAMIVAATARSLKQFPYLASQYSENGRILTKDINIGVAMAKGDDLFVPVVKSKYIDKSLEDVENEIQRLSKAVESDQLYEKDLIRGAFTISNLGAYGIDSFIAVINPPEVGILAVASMKEKAIVVDGAVVIRPIINMTLSMDHRIASGTYAADFLRTLKKNLERK